MRRKRGELLFPLYQSSKEGEPLKNHKSFLGTDSYTRDEPARSRQGRCIPPDCGLSHDDHAGVHAGASAGTMLPPDEIDVELHLKAGRPPFDVNSVYLKIGKRFRVVLKYRTDLYLKR